MACKRTKLDSTERLTLQDMARGDEVLVKIRRVTLDDSLHDLGFWEEHIAALEGENERLREYVQSMVCPGCRPLATRTVCFFGDRHCTEAVAALKGGDVARTTQER